VRCPPAALAGSIVAGLLAAADLAGAAQPSPTSCVACHGDPAIFGPRAQLVQDFAEDVHASAGLSCHDCHGGNPDPRGSGDLGAAMDASFAPSPYRGAPERAAVPESCGRCHSDPTYMRRFRPDARVDQEREYWTSGHGQALRGGDAQVPTCADCHGAHGIRRVGDPRSPVHPTTVAETCRACHADAARMARYERNGRPLPVDQYARWRESVHARALLDREDLSAPTCNDCHGNHGAAPPGLDSIAFVCGQCHVKEAELFRRSRKHEGFASHHAYLAAAGEEGCRACHAAPDPAAELGGAGTLGECTACHDNHGVVRPTIAMLSPLPESPCALCHEGPSAQPVEQEESVRRFRAMRDQLLTEARSRGLEGDERFDWLVDRALSLPFHSVALESGELTPHPEFERLFAKFRIGKTYYAPPDSERGEERRARIVRCASCHAAEPRLGEGRGLAVAAELLERMHELTSWTAAAERTLLWARRGGVEVRPAQLEVDRSVDAQIELEALVHTFSVEPTSEFVRKQQEGLEHARAALAAGRRAIAERDARRRGLAGFLLLTLVFLVALALRIRRV